MNFKKKFVFLSSNFEQNNIFVLYILIYIFNSIFLIKIKKYIFLFLMLVISILIILQFNFSFKRFLHNLMHKYAIFRYSLKLFDFL